MKPDPVSTFLVALIVLTLAICVVGNLPFFAQMARDIPALLTGSLR